MKLERARQTTIRPLIQQSPPRLRAGGCGVITASHTDHTASSRSPYPAPRTGPHSPSTHPRWLPLRLSTAAPC